MKNGITCNIRIFMWHSFQTQTKQRKKMSTAFYALKSYLSVFLIPSNQFTSEGTTASSRYFQVLWENHSDVSKKLFTKCTNSSIQGNSKWNMGPVQQKKAKGDLSSILNPHVMACPILVKWIRIHPNRNL